METVIGDTFPGRTTHVYHPLTYPPAASIQSFRAHGQSSVPLNSPASSKPPDLVASPQQTTDPLPQCLPPSTGTIGVLASGYPNGAFCNVYMHANYSNPTIYPSIVSAAGLNYGTPFGSPMVFASAIPPMSPRGQLGQIPVPSRSSTGNFPLHAALDAMQSPSRGPLPMVGGTGTDSGETYVDVEDFAPVQQNASAWKPSWEVFPLKVYRGYDLKVVDVQRTWDDEELLRELGTAYDKLRGRLRKYFSFMDVWWVSAAPSVPSLTTFVLVHSHVRSRYVTMVAVRSISLCVPGNRNRKSNYLRYRSPLRPRSSTCSRRGWGPQRSARTATCGCDISLRTPNT